MSLTERLWQVYHWLEPRLAPGVRYAQTDFEEHLFAAVAAGCRWLDLGCGHELLPEWRAHREAELVQRPSLLVGLDPELSVLRRHGGIRMRVCGDGAFLPFADGAFDLVTANMVVEHLETPDVLLREVARVLAPGGVFLFHTPNATGYSTVMLRLLPDAIRALGARIIEGRDGDDRFRTYYRANDPDRIGRLASLCGLGVDRIELIRSNAMVPLIIPVAIGELLLLRALARPGLRRLRPNLIAALRKRDEQARRAIGKGSGHAPYAAEVASAP